MYVAVYKLYMLLEFGYFHVRYSSGLLDYSIDAKFYDNFLPEDIYPTLCLLRLPQDLYRAEITYFSGMAVNHDSFTDRFERLVKAWGGRKIRFHDLRHTAITLMIGDGIDVKTVKEIAGHKDISTTMNYVHLLGANLRNAGLVFNVGPSKNG